MHYKLIITTAMSETSSEIYIINVAFTHYCEAKINKTGMVYSTQEYICTTWIPCNVASSFASILTYSKYKSTGAKVITLHSNKLLFHVFCLTCVILKEAVEINGIYNLHYSNKGTLKLNGESFPSYLHPLPLFSCPLSLFLLDHQIKLHIYPSHGTVSNTELPLVCL
jgi:hypothetical protein